MKTYVKIIILIVTLGVGFGIGWFCREQIFRANFTDAVGHEYIAEKLGGESMYKPGMKPVDFVQKVGSELMKL